MTILGRHELSLAFKSGFVFKSRGFLDMNRIGVTKYSNNGEFSKALVYS